MVYLHLRQDRNDSDYHTVTKHVCGESNGIACIGEGVAKVRQYKRPAGKVI